jgi:voltage-gated potassium channel
LNRKQINQAAWRLLQPVALLQVIVATSIIGFMILEDYNFLEAVYMTTITITTTGFMEVHPLSPAGRVFTSILLIVSWGTLAFAITRITQYVVNGEINKYFKTRKLMSEIHRLKGHVIICGFGRNGHQAAQTLHYHNQPFVIIEKNEVLIQHALKEQPELLHLHGNGTDDEMLIEAGIKQAKALITTLPLDADNLFIVLSARELNPDLLIISRASDAASVHKLKKAGANNVIMPDKIGGAHMANLVSKPDVIEFIDFISGEEGNSIHIESVPFERLPMEIQNMPLSQIMAWKKTGVNCIGIKDATGKFIVNPPESTLITGGMKVIVMGTRLQIENMKGNIA